MTAFAKSSAGIRPTVLKAFRPDSIKKKQWGTLPVLGRCALVLNGIANLFCPTCRTNTRCGRPGFFNISISSSCSSKNFSFKWTIVIRLTFSSNKKKPFFIFSYKKRQKLAFLFYLRWRPTTLFHQFGLSFFLRWRPTTLLLIIIYKNTYPKSIWELVSAIKNTLEIEINLYFAKKFGGIFITGGLL